MAPPALGHLSTTNNVASVVMEFDNDSVVGTSGSLTISNMNIGNRRHGIQAVVYGQEFQFWPANHHFGGDWNRRQRKIERVAVRQSLGHADVLRRDFRRRQRAARQRAAERPCCPALNTYTGNTSIDAGTLSITNPYLADAADVLLTTGGIFNLGFAGTDTINRLFFDGAATSGGTWGATGSGATNINDTFFTGSGVLNVLSALGSGSGLEGGAVPEPRQSLALLTIVRHALLAAVAGARYVNELGGEIDTCAVNSGESAPAAVVDCVRGR